MARNIEADLKLCDAATEGPWGAIYYDHTVVKYVKYQNFGETCHLPNVLTIADMGRGYGQDGEAEANAKFIAAARTGWQETIQELMEARKRIAELELAIRQHRDSYLSGDDKCWKDNEVLYKHLPEGYTQPERDTTVELELCRQYIASCHDPRISYTSPQRRIEELEAVIERYRVAMNRARKTVEDLEDVLDE